MKTSQRVPPHSTQMRTAAPGASLPIELIPIPKDRILLKELEEMRKKVLELSRQGRGPTENPIIRGELLYFKVTRDQYTYYLVLCPDKFGRVDELPAERSIPELRFTWAVACDIELLHEKLKEYLAAQHI